MGLTEEALSRLRQTLLSATVENKPKRDALVAEYRSRGNLAEYNSAVKVFNSQTALQFCLEFLESAKRRGDSTTRIYPPWLPVISLK